MIRYILKSWFEFTAKIVAGTETVWGKVVVILRLLLESK